MHYPVYVLHAYYTLCVLYAYVLHVVSIIRVCIIRVLHISLRDDNKDKVSVRASPCEGERG